MVNEVPQIEKPKNKYCWKCYKKTAIFRKVYYVKDGDSLHAVKSYNNFYICQNELCAQYVYIPVNIKKRNAGEIFEWYRYDF